MNRFKRILSSEIGIEFKACIYFFAILFFYSMYRIWQGSFWASIVIMTEMIFTAYFMGYAQVYFLQNFDEAEKFGIKEMLASLLCTGIYTAVSYVGKWYDRNRIVTVFFFLYMILCYVSAFFAYKVKRDIDTAQLNQQLEEFKRKKN